MAVTFEEKVALVTGAGAGLGRASALAFAREGAKVIVADLDVQSGQQTVQLIDAAGGEAIFVKVDVTKATEVEAMVNKAVETYSRLDCAHNNAGIEELPYSFLEGTEEQWYCIMDVNLKGVWLCLKYEISLMVKQGGGAIVNTSSIQGLVGSPHTPIYSASKHGVIGLTKVAAVEFAKEGIRVNAVCPGSIQGTPMTERLSTFFQNHPQVGPKFTDIVPMGRRGDSEEVAEVVLWLCSDAASYVTGNIMSVDGGFVIR